MNEVASTKRGRPREFDRDQALDCAVRVFWACGFEGASMDALTENMGINRPSLYAAFGNKHDLFMEAIDRYAATNGTPPLQSFDKEPDIERAVAAYFDGAIRGFTADDGPAGCFLACVATEVAERDQKVRSKLSAMVAALDAHFAGRLRSAQDDIRMESSAEPLLKARMIVSFTQALALRARLGADRDELSDLAKGFCDALFRV